MERPAPLRAFALAAFILPALLASGVSAAPPVATPAAPAPVTAPPAAPSAAPASTATASTTVAASPVPSSPVPSSPVPSTTSVSAGADATASSEPIDLAAALDPETRRKLEDEERARIEQSYVDRFTGFQHALRIGAEIPFGDIPARGFAYDVGSINDYVQWRFPVWVDVGYRVGPEWWFGGYLQVGLGPAGEGCPGNVDCFWTDFRIGLSARHHFSPLSKWDPSIGLGLGYEWFEPVVTVNVTVPGQDPVSLRFRRNLSGMQAILDIGADYELGHSFTVGPFLALTGGAFFSDSITCPAQVESECPRGSSVDNGAFHGGVSLLARGRFGP